MKNRVKIWGVVAVILLAGCDKAELAPTTSPEDIGSVPIVINLLNDGQDEQTRTSVNSSNIDRFYLEIDQEGAGYDYLVEMRREYTPTEAEKLAHPGKSDLYRYYERPAGVWSEWKAYDISLGADGTSVEVSSTPRTEPMYYYNLGKPIKYRASKSDYFTNDMGISEGYDETTTGVVYDNSTTSLVGYNRIFAKNADGGLTYLTDDSEKVVVCFMGDLSPEQIYHFDFLHSNSDAANLSFNAGNWMLDIHLKHKAVKARIDIEFTGNFAKLFELSDSVDGGDETVVGGVTLSSTYTGDISTRDALNSYFGTSTRGVTSSENGSSERDVINMTPTFFGKVGSKWIATYETLLGAQGSLDPEVPTYNFRVDIETLKFEVAESKYTIDETRTDRLFSFETAVFTKFLVSGEQLYLKYELGDDYTTEPY